MPRDFGVVASDLRTALLDLAQKMETAGLPLVLGGGYGLYLWQTELVDSAIAGGP